MAETTVKIGDVAAQLRTASRLVLETDFFWIYAGDGTQVRIPAEFVRAYLTANIKPEVGEDGNWTIGGVDTGVKAEGVTPQLRGGTEGIEVSYDKGATWTMTVLYSTMDPDLEGLEAAYKQVTEGEAERVSNEEARVAAETARVNAEKSRASAETARATAETTRQTNETTRQADEETRQSNEATRKTNETARANAEATRESNETTRKTAESTREKSETTRESNETARKSNEETRQSNEATRKTNESTRQSQEETRQTNETARVEAEKARASAETARASAETARVNAEAARVTEYATLKQDCTEATEIALSMANLANTAAANATAQTSAAQTAAENATTAAATANDAAEAATDAAAAAQEVVDSASQVESLGLIPTAMTLDYPERITVGNTEGLKINAVLSPAQALQNVLFLGDSTAVTVAPDGTIAVNGTGKSVIHVVPTMKTSLYRTITIDVVKPGIRLYSATAMRLDSSGNIMKM